jgi:hypothetical protein
VQPKELATLRPHAVGRITGTTLNGTRLERHEVGVSGLSADGTRVYLWPGDGIEGGKAAMTLDAVERWEVRIEGD